MTKSVFGARDEYVRSHARKVAESLFPPPPEVAAQARAILTGDRSEWEAALRRCAEAAPPLSEEQREVVARIFGGRGTVSPAAPSAEGPRYEPYVPTPGVYFVRAGNRIKIGMSSDVPRRVKSLQTASSEPLQLLAIKQGGRAEEKSLHDRFAHLRQHGEWFTAAPELLAFIAAPTA